MTTNFSGAPDVSGSAKILQFPLRGRFAAGGQVGGLGGFQVEAAAPVANVSLPRGVKLASGSGWYHDAAIQDAIRAERTGKN
jgi:hypothetical protein